MILGQAISHSLKHLAERRTDIFGVGEEAAQEAAIGKKMGEEETRRSAEPEKVSFLWFYSYYGNLVRANLNLKKSQNGI